ncbi:MAG: HNH endonuclease, partial [Deltaproteobacteria bacterium]|nr:HNH endonuclease [Deltaproteobacteria bacterium]
MFCSEGGKDTPNNLITVCSACHGKIHDGTIKPSWKGQNPDILGHDTKLNVIAKRLGDYLSTIGLLANTAFVFITKINILSYNLEKTHCNYAIMIALESTQIEKKSQTYIKRCVAKGDYKLAMGKRSETR